MKRVCAFLYRQSRLITVHQTGPDLTIPLPRIVQIGVGRCESAVQAHPTPNRVVAQGGRAALGRGSRRAELTPAAAAQDPGIVRKGGKGRAGGGSSEEEQGIFIRIVCHPKVGTVPGARKVNLFPGSPSPDPELIRGAVGVPAI